MPEPSTVPGSRTTQISRLCPCEERTSKQSFKSSILLAPTSIIPLTASPCYSRHQPTSYKALQSAPSLSHLTAPLLPHPKSKTIIKTANTRVSQIQENVEISKKNYYPTFPTNYDKDARTCLLEAIAGRGKLLSASPF